VSLWNVETEGVSKGKGKSRKKLCPEGYVQIQKRKPTPKQQTEGCSNPYSKHNYVEMDSDDDFKPLQKKYRLPKKC
jgi:hypothetical protein